MRTLRYTAALVAVVLFELALAYTFDVLPKQYEATAIVLGLLMWVGWMPVAVLVAQPWRDGL